MGGDCCPNMQGVNLACCFSGALQMDADTAEQEAKKVAAEADKDTAAAKSAASAAQAAADEAKKTKEANEKEAADIQTKIDDLNDHATAAQKKSREAAVQATNDATAAAKQALAAEAAAAHAKKLEEEQQKIVAETSADAAKKKAAAAEAKANADKLNAIAGAATAKLNDAKKKAEEEAAAAKLKEDAEEKVVFARNEEAAKIKAAADKELKEANAKKAAAEGMIAKIDSAQCAKHAGCKGLEGYCCPTLNFAKMHLGSAKLDGAQLACCGGSAELASEAAEETLADTQIVKSDGFGSGAIMLSAICGSALTFAAFQLSTRKEDQSATYQTM